MENGRRRKGDGKKEEETGDCLVIDLLKFGNTEIFWRVPVSKGMP